MFYRECCPLRGAGQNREQRDYSTRWTFFILGAGTAGVGSKQDQGAALALAIYKSLYDSNAYGSAANNNFTFDNGLNGNVSANYLSDLAYLKNFGSPADGYILRPNPDAAGSGQDMILLASGNPQTVSAVPEPTTVIAGSLLLLPFAASALRILRKNRTA